MIVWPLEFAKNANYLFISIYLNSFLANILILLFCCSTYRQHYSVFFTIKYDSFEALSIGTQIYFSDFGLQLLKIMRFSEIFGLKIKISF